ncbi:hypothetical protein ACFQRB_11060 [Halobaculum litoreum]|uniref:Uncharacterized protein n=1 Tax=Halobaculum litoreum TaxID=3031998 RepID=A0ABD5XP39_9EURY
MTTEHDRDCRPESDRTDRIELPIATLRALAGSRGCRCGCCDCSCGCCDCPCGCRDVRCGRDLAAGCCGEGAAGPTRTLRAGDRCGCCVR